MNVGSRMAAGVLNDSDTIHSTGISASAITTTFATPHSTLRTGVVAAAISRHLFPMAEPGAAVPKPLMNMNAMIATQMKMRIEMADPMTRLSQPRMDTDPVPLLPPVRM